MMGNFAYGGMGVIGMAISLVIMIAIAIGFVYFVVWAVRKSSGNTNISTLQNPASQTSKEIAQIRYAKGEITRDEYQQILSDLGK
jgi:putative membrane protein